MKAGALFFKFNKGLLFACLSMYFGTGWSLILFSFPGAEKLTPSNYYQQFVPQVTAATGFFRGMTIVIMLCCILLIMEEWKSPRKWYGAGILAAIALATMLTICYIFPYNKRMEAGITSQGELTLLLTKWMRLNMVRVGIWTVQWLLLLIYFITNKNLAGSQNRQYAS